MRPSLSIVIAAYNEERSIAAVCERCLAVLARCTDDFEIVLLDDASTDRTPSIMADLQRRHANVIRIIRHAQNQGIAATFEEAYRAGCKQYIFDVPGDGEYPPEALEQILPLLGRYDVVVCNRRYKNYTPYRRLISALYRGVPRLLFGIDLIDPGSAKCRHRDVIHEIKPRSRGVFVEAERIIRAVRRGYRYTSVDIDPELREGGRARGGDPRLALWAGGEMLALWVRLTIFREPP